MKKFILVGIAASTLSACNLMGDPTNSGFAGNGYGYQVGAVTNDGLQGFAGMVAGATVTPPSSTTATYNGRFEVAYIDFILTSSDGQVSGNTTLDRGDINLQADFAAGTLVGGGTGLDGGFTNFLLNENQLSVDGKIEGTTLTGTVTYDGVSGPLSGLVGGNETIGVFHGHDDNNVIAGGFIAN